MNKFRILGLPCLQFLHEYAGQLSLCLCMLQAIFSRLEGSGGPECIKCMSSDAGCPKLAVRCGSQGYHILSSCQDASYWIPCILFHACTYPELQWQRRQPRGPPEEPPSLTSNKCLASLRQQPYPHTHTAGETVCKTTAQKFLMYEYY